MESVSNPTLSTCPSILTSTPIGSSISRVTTIPNQIKAQSTVTSPLIASIPSRTFSLPPKMYYGRARNWGKLWAIERKRHTAPFSTRRWGSSNGGLSSRTQRIRKKWRLSWRRSTGRFWEEDMWNTMKDVPTMTISSKIMNLACISLRKSLITSPEWQFQLIHLDTRSPRLPFSRILELKGSSWNGQMSIFSSKTRRSSSGGQGPATAMFMAHCQLISDGPSTASKTSSSAATSTKTCAPQSKATCPTSEAKTTSSNASSKAPTSCVTSVMTFNASMTTPTQWSSPWWRSFRFKSAIK